MKLFNKSALKIFSKISLVAFAVGAFFVVAPTVHAATSPTLAESAIYSVLGGAEVTCIGPTTTTGAVGVSPGTSLTGFPVPCTAAGGTQNNNASAIAAQADSLSAFGVLDAGANADANCIGGVLPDATDLTTLSPLVPGLYCSAGSFLLTGNLTLTGTSGVWVFKTVSTVITSPGSSVTGGDPCNVWWRVGSSATLDTTTSFIGTIIAQNGTSTMNTGATLQGRILGLSAATVTLDSNVITTPCMPAASGGSTVSTTPGFPNAGVSQAQPSIPWNVVIPVSLLVLLTSSYIVRKRISTSK